jgi:RNA polymerase sigma-70 factor (ECF subfamily)
MTASQQEIWWVLRAQAGDKEALSDLLKAVQEPVYRYILKMVGERALAEDILQDVFLLIYRKLRWLDSPELFKPWAYRIATRAAFKRLKREQRWSEQIRDDAVLNAIPAASAEIDQSISIDELTQLLDQISPASRAVIILHYLDDMSLAEVAEVLEVNIGTVKSRLAYGLASLRRVVREQSS